MKKGIIILITLYQKIFSPDQGVFRKNTPTCFFYPTCSDYTKEAIDKYGVIKGLCMGVKRVLRCRPGQKNNIDQIS